MSASPAATTTAVVTSADPSRLRAALRAARKADGTLSSSLDHASATHIPVLLFILDLVALLGLAATAQLYYTETAIVSGDSNATTYSHADGVNPFISATSASFQSYSLTDVGRYVLHDGNTSSNGTHVVSVTLPRTWYTFGFPRLFDTRSSAADLVVLWVLRAALFIVTVLYLRRLRLNANLTSGGTVDEETTAAHAPSRGDGSTSEKKPLLGERRGHNDAAGTVTALSINADDGPTNRLTAAAGAVPSHGLPTQIPWPEARAAASRRNHEARNLRVLMAVVFVVFTATNVLTALKGIVFEFSFSPLQEVCLGLSILFSSALLRLVVGQLRSHHDTEADIKNLNDVHSHPLRFRTELAFCICDVCRYRIREREAFSCETCDFDACANCVRASLARHRGGGGAGAATGGGHERAGGGGPPGRGGTGNGGGRGPNAPPVSSVTPPPAPVAGGASGGGGGGGAPIVVPVTSRYEPPRITNLEYVKRILKLSSAYWHIVLLSLMLIFFIQALRMASPHYQGNLIDCITRQDSSFFIYNLKFLAVIRCVQLILGSLSSLCSGVVSRLLTNSARRSLFKALIHQDIEFFDIMTTGTLTSRMSNDVAAMLAPATSLLYSMLSNLAMLVGGCVMSLYVCWRLALLTITIIGPILVITEVYTAFSRRMNRRIRDSLANANSVATEAFGNIRTIRSMSTEPIELQKFEASMMEALGRSVIDAVASGGTYLVTGLLDLSMVVMTLGFGGWMVLHPPPGEDSQSLTVGKLVAFQLYASMMNTAYSSLNNMVNEMTKATGAAERIFALLEMKPRVATIVDQDASGKAGAASQFRAITAAASSSGNTAESAAPRLIGTGMIPDAFLGRIELHDVSFRYVTRPLNIVLNRVSFVCEPRKVTAIVGASGGGKSTIVSLLLRLYDPETGTITLDGRPLTDISLPWLHQQTAVVMQETQLFATSIKDNIAYGAPEGTTMEHITEAARKANAHDFISSFEEGYLTQVGERGTRLSGGQRQRISIARAFLRKPRLLLLDEATSALDAHSEAQVQRALDSLLSDLCGVGLDDKKTKSHDNASEGGDSSPPQHRTTVVVVAHRLSTIRNADQIVVMNNGAVAEVGTHDSLSNTADSVYRRIVLPTFQPENSAANAAAAAPDAAARLAAAH